MNIVEFNSYDEKTKAIVRKYIFAHWSHMANLTDEERAAWVERSNRISEEMYGRAIKATFRGDFHKLVMPRSRP